MYQTKAEFAVVKLKQQILAGEWQPNQRLVLSALTEKLGLSMVPIREALSSLEKEGFVIQTPHQGYSVAPMSIDELEELMFLREVLTVKALPLVIENISQNEITELYSITDEMKEIQRLLGSEGAEELLEQFRSLNKSFHRTVVAASGLVHLPIMLENLMDLSNRYLNLVESNLGIREVDIKEHVRIVEEIEKKDLVTLKRLVIEHQQRVMKEFTTHISHNRRIINGIFRTA